MKQKIPVAVPIVLVPILIVATAFVIDIASVNAVAFVICSAIVYAIFLVAYGAFGKIWAAWLTASVPVFLLEVINFYKLQINDTPLLLSDFSLIGGADKIIGFALPQIKITAAVIAGICLFLIATAGLVFIERMYIKGKKSRLISLGIGLAVSLVLIIPPTHRLIAEAADAESTMPQQLVISHGVVAGLYCSGAKPYDIPDITLTKDDIQKVIDSAEKPVLKTETPPTVIFLMSESFFDVGRLPGISFSEDPIPNFHRLQKEYSTGKFISNTFCGGTGYVEMEFLTGLCSRYLDTAHTLTSLPNDDVYQFMPSISDVFKSHGYSTTFIHSYNSVLYNRPTIYRSFDFDDVRFDVDFTVPIEYSGGYISDMTLTSEIISAYEKEKETPSMIYAISMENHQPFFGDKYDDDSGIEIYGDMPSEDKKMFESYIHGLHNADKALGSLIEYFSNVDEPVLIAFWGDHLPNLPTGEDSNIYRDLGYCADGESYELKAEDYFNMLTTDFVIWDNFGLEKEDKALGCSMFGIEVMERIGLEMNDYFTWISSYVKDNYLVYSYAIFSPSDDNVYAYIPDEYTKVMNDYHQVVYDIVYGEHELFGKQR